MKERTITAICLIGIIGACVWFKFLLIPSLIITGSMIWEIFKNSKSKTSVWTAIAAYQASGVLYAILLSRKEIFFITLVVVLNDTMAYFFGKYCNFGWTEKPFPKTSPNKTYTGLIFGLAFATQGAILFDFCFPTYGLVKAALMGLFFAVCAVIGDYVESKFKRVNNIKDSGQNMWTGKLLKGHGGFYDRFDAISMALWGWGLLKLFLELKNNLRP